MKRTPTHRELRALLPEVALGVASGDDRAAVLEHVAGCDECRRDLETLSETADAVLLLAPEREPPAGFESGVLDRLGRPLRRPRPSGRWSRVVQFAAAAAIAAVAVLAPYSALTRDDVQLGRLYRGVLAEANGVALLSLPLVDSRGVQVGHVYGYEGRPSWVLVAVRSGAPGRYRAGVQTIDGDFRSLGSFGVAGGRGSVGKAIPGHFFEVTRIVVNGPREQLVARMPPPPRFFPLG